MFRGSSDLNADIFQLLDDVSSRGELLVMIKVYLDLGDKRDASDGVICVAATAFKPIEYKRFVRPWNRMLRGWHASAFHAADFYPGYGEFVRDTPETHERHLADSRVIPHLIGENVSRILAVSFRPEEFQRVVPPFWTEHFGTSLHSMSVQFALVYMGYWAQEIRYRQGFAYFMESGDDDAAEVVRVVEAMKAQPHTGALIQVRSFTQIDKGSARGLEASDFVAWHWNKHYMDKLRTGENENPRKDFAALVQSSEQKIDVAFLTGASLKYYFSLFEEHLTTEATAGTTAPR